MTFPHVGQSPLLFNMFVLLYIVEKLHTQFLKFSSAPFSMALEVFKEKSKKMNLKRRLKSLFFNQSWIILPFWKA
jgi:hypothetical protein